MKIKVDVNSINRIIDPKYPIEKLYNQLKGLKGRTGLVFGEPSVGLGQLHWTLDGEDWIPFSDLDDNIKPQASVLFKDSKKRLKDILGESSLLEEFLTIPDEKNIFFRNLDSEPEIGLTCWGYRHPDFKDGLELETWIKKARLQDVAISFSWNGQKLSNYSFKLTTHPRQTDSNGIFFVDQPLPVGNDYTMTAKDGRTFTLTVIEGQKEYDFDLTKFFTVEVSVNKDEEALEEKELTINFNGDNVQLKTDATGHATLRLPFECTADGLVKQPQEECIVTCEDKTSSQTPSERNNLLFFLFQFTTQVEDEVVAPPPPPYEDPEEKEEENLAPEIPQKIGITVLDYGGFPVKEMEVALILPSKKEVKFVTDENGRIEFPKDWMQGMKGKIKVRFTATPEYQKTHDFHLNDKKKKEQKQ